MIDPFIQWVQERLTVHGFPCGAIDGYDGPITRAALRAFQEANGLPANEKADVGTVNALRLNPKPVEAPVDREDDGPEAALPKDPTRNLWPRQSDVPYYYGAVGQNCVRIEIPFDMYLAWSKGTRIRGMTVHSRVAESASRVLRGIATGYSAKERRDIGIDLFGGSLNVRKMRGGSRYSMHSWGIAIDFDPERNQLKWGRDKARLAKPDAEHFWRLWEEEGWLSLGRARNFDFMHVQAARL